MLQTAPYSTNCLAFDKEFKLIAPIAPSLVLAKLICEAYQAAISTIEAPARTPTKRTGSLPWGRSRSDDSEENSTPRPLYSKD